MAYSLRDGVHCCIANSRLVLLDERADRYSCLPPHLEAALMALLSGEDTTVDLAEQDALLQQGIIIAGAGPSPQRLRSDLVDVSTWRSLSSNRKGAPFLVCLALLMILVTAIRSRRVPLQTQFEDLRGLKRRATGVTRPVPAPLVAAFLATRRFWSHNNHCLSRSIALLNFLAIFGHHPRLVLGVTMSPFRAHAWVQHGDLVLNDEIDTVAVYTPILVI